MTFASEKSTMWINKVYLESLFEWNGYHWRRLARESGNQIKNKLSRNNTHKGLKPKLFSTMPWYHDIMQKSSLKSFIL